MCGVQPSITIVKPPWQALIDAWLAEVRGMCSTGPRPELPFPVEEAAAALGVRVRTAPLSPTLWGLTWDATEVTLNASLPQQDQRFALAHELAHIGQARGYIADGPTYSEWIADWFARELLAPLETLAQLLSATDIPCGQPDVGRLAATLQVPLNALLLQVGLLGAAPRLWTHNGWVLCSRCGDRTPLPGCSCITYSGSVTNPRDRGRKPYQSAASAVSCRGNQPEGPKSLITTQLEVIEPRFEPHPAVSPTYGIADLPSPSRIGVVESLPLQLRTRQFMERDRLDVIRLLRILPQLYPDGEQWLLQRLSDSLHGQATCTLVEDYISRDLCGVAIVTPKPSGSIKLSTFYVSEKYRMKGVGTLLLNRLMANWEQQRPREVYVTVAHYVEPALQTLIQPAGFHRIAFEENRYGPGRHEAVWKRTWEADGRPSILHCARVRGPNLWTDQALGIPTHMPES
jgi:Zn-dependent peptidase ImmA (M78 family)/GNAT superfamily N-acetyltransferase